MSKISSNWKDYEIIATGGGEKLERWGDTILLRPDPQVIWPARTKLSAHKGLSAVYSRNDKGGGCWQQYKKIPENFVIGYKDLKFSLKLMDFKHVGLFPEQAANWDMMTAIIKREFEICSGEATGSGDIFLERARREDAKRLREIQKTIKDPVEAMAYALNNSARPDLDSRPDFDLTAPDYAKTIFTDSGDADGKIIQHMQNKQKHEISILNLFAYTGGATVACAKAGAKVTHVDAAKGMVERAKTNANLSGIAPDKIRYIIDDCAKFVNREIKRGVKYDAVIMDPPSYGRGPNGEMWKLEDNLFDLVSLTAKVLKPNPLFMLINSYTTGLQPTVIENILTLCLKDFAGSAQGYEVCLPTSEGILLPCGCSGLFTCANAVLP